MICYVIHPGERSAGINSYEEQVEIKVKWDPNTVNDPEFVESFKEFLSGWYDGAKILTESEMAKLSEGESNNYQRQYEMERALLTREAELRVR